MKIPSCLLIGFIAFQPLQVQSLQRHHDFVVPVNREVKRISSGHRKSSIIGCWELTVGTSSGRYHFKSNGQFLSETFTPGLSPLRTPGTWSTDGSYIQIEMKKDDGTTKKVVLQATSSFSLRNVQHGSVYVRC